MDEWVVLKKCVRCMQWLCCVFCGWQGLANRSMRIQDLYVGAVPIPQFIKKSVGDGVVLLVTTPD